MRAKCSFQEAFQRIMDELCTGVEGVKAYIVKQYLDMILKKNIKLKSE